MNTLRIGSHVYDITRPHVRGEVYSISRKRVGIWQRGMVGQRRYIFPADVRSGSRYGVNQYRRSVA